MLADKPVPVPLCSPQITRIFLPERKSGLQAQRHICFTHKLTVRTQIHSDCLRVATGAPWHFGKRQIYEYLGVSLFADHIRALIESFRSELACVGKSLFRQVRGYLSHRGLN